MLLTLEEARSYARDYESPDGEIEDLIAGAESLISGGCGKSFDRADPRSKLLAKLYVADLTENRVFTAAGAESARLLVSSLTRQLRTQTDEADRILGRSPGGGG